MDLDDAIKKLNTLESDVRQSIAHMLYCIAEDLDHKEGIANLFTNEERKHRAFAYRHAASLITGKNEDLWANVQLPTYVMKIE